ncbi:uncharacterized protein LOC119733162 isoform X1 [Patiria miniata]|uniref:Uncharacterized protein n=1 Tax=Patiria miniata TaxID=46514 RepID=A0A914AG14_PATMI|nr:uncharacterized protein LOC119733162 isoform X1 [Patiria miniata]
MAEPPAKRARRRNETQTNPGPSTAPASQAAATQQLPADGARYDPQTTQSGSRQPSQQEPTQQPLPQLQPRPGETQTNPGPSTAPASQAAATHQLPADGVRDDQQTTQSGSSQPSQQEPTQQPLPQLQPRPERKLDVEPPHASDNVMRALERAGKRKKRKAEATVLKDQGNQAFHKGNYTIAVQLYTQGLECLKDFVVLYTNRAQAYNELEKFSEAMEDCRTALQLEPNNVKALAHLGKAQQGLKDYEAAVTTYQEILKIDEKYEKMVADYPRISGASIGNTGTISGSQSPVIVGPSAVIITYNKLSEEREITGFQGPGTADNLQKELDFENKFRDWLKQIGEGNVLAMEYLLRFYCSRSMQAAGLTLDHIREMQGDEEELQRFARLLLWESSSEELATKLVRPTRVNCKNNEDLKSLSYYLQHVTPPLEGTHFYLDVRKQELTLLRGILLSDSMESAGLIYVDYHLSEQEEEGLSLLEETLGVVDEQDRAQLGIVVKTKSWFDVGRVSHSFFRMQKQIGKLSVDIDQRSPDEVVNLLKALEGCRLDWLTMYGTNLHARVGDVSHISSSLTILHLSACRLVDDDVKDLISILPAGHGLESLSLSDNAFSLDVVRALTHHLRGLPKLHLLWLCNISLPPELVRQVVSQDLPHLKEIEEGEFEA